MENSHIELGEFLREWKKSYRRITLAALKKLIEDEILTPSAFDKILGLKYEKQLLKENSFLWSLGPNMDGRGILFCEGPRKPVLNLKKWQKGWGCEDKMKYIF